MNDLRQQLSPDPVLSEHSQDVESRISEIAEKVEADDFPALMDSLSRDIFAAAMQRINAHSGTIWILDKQRTRLVVGHAYPGADLMGKELPLDEGLISLVIASEQGICENQVYQNARHSKRIDEQLGMITCAMIAVPFYFGGVIGGVISAVQWKKKTAATDPPGFSAPDLGKMKLLSLAFERLITYQLVRVTLDLHL